VFLEHPGTRLEGNSRLCLEEAFRGVAPKRLVANSTRAEAVLVCVAEEPKFGPDVSWSRECRKYDADEETQRRSEDLADPDCEGRLPQRSCGS